MSFQSNYFCIVNRTSGYLKAGVKNTNIEIILEIPSDKWIEIQKENLTSRKQILLDKQVHILQDLASEYCQLRWKMKDYVKTERLVKNVG